MLFISFSTSLTDFFPDSPYINFYCFVPNELFFTWNCIQFCKCAVEELITSFQCAVFTQSLSTDYAFITFVKFLHLDFKQFGLK